MSDHEDTQDEQTADGGRRVARALVVGAAGIVPVLGPIASALIDEFMPEQRARRTVEFLSDLRDTLAGLEDRIDLDFVRADEFQGLMEEAFERVASRRTEGMRAYYAAAVANTALPNRPDEQARFRMMDILAGLRPSHMALLAAIAKGGQEPSPASEAFTVGQAAVASVNAATRDLPGDVSADLSDLERRGLTVRLDEALLAVAHDVRGLLTPLGSALVAFVGRPAPR